MGTTVKFSADPAATDIASFNVYRSFNGPVTQQEPFTVQGLMVFCRPQGQHEFTKINISSNDPVEIVNQLNKYAFLKAAILGTSPNRTIIIRTTAEFVEFQMTAGLAALGINAGVYRPKMNFTLVGNVAFVAAQADYSYDDADGDPTDFYQIRDVNLTAVEQPPDIAFQALSTIQPTCAVEGVVVAANGVALKGTLVFAKLYLENGEISKRPVKTTTDDQGRWRLDLIQCQRYYVDIPDADFGNPYVIPAQGQADLKDMAVDSSWRNRDVFVPSR